MKTSYIIALILIILGGAFAVQNGEIKGLTEIQDIKDSALSQTNSDSCPASEDLKRVVERADITTGQGAGNTKQYLKWLNWKEESLGKIVGEAKDWKVYGDGGMARDGGVYPRGYYLELDCHQGNKEGENVNYKYCNIGDGLTNSQLKMRKTVVSESGEIQEKKTVAVKKAVYNSDQQVQKLSCN